MSRRNIFITGAARGIGKACAQRFAAAGAFVGLYDVDAEQLARTVEELGLGDRDDRCCHQELDVRERASVEAAVAHFAAHTDGRMHALINNAAVMHVGPFEALSAEAHAQIVAVNVRGVIDVAHASFELLRRTPGACVVNLSSAAALYGVPEMASYSASKHAVRGLSEALELEWAVHDIRVCDVMPAFVDTELLRGTGRLTAEASMGVRLQPADVAEVVWRAATAGPRAHRTHWPVGAQMRLGLGVGKLVPSALVRATLKWMTKL